MYVCTFNNVFKEGPSHDMIDCTTYIYIKLLLGERSEPHMDDTFAIFHILLLSYVRRGLCDPPFFFFGVRCAQYKVHAQCSFAALAPHMPCMLLVGLV